MKNLVLAGILVLMLIMPAFTRTTSDETGNITVVMTNFRNEKGRAQVTLFNSEKGFPLDPNYAYMVKTGAINGGTATVKFMGVGLGEHAICAIHDEDMDGDFDRNWLFLPGEGWGTSNDVGGFFGPGNYNDSRFILDSTDATVNIIIHY